MIGILNNKFALYTCPLSGLKINGRATFGVAGNASNEAPNVLYTFGPIGSAIIDLGQLFALSIAEQQGRLQPRTDLAGACREAKEHGFGPIDISDKFSAGPDKSWPSTFDEKCLHFLRLFYESGGKERKKRTIHVLEDFPMAFAQDAEEFYRVLESLLDEGKLRYDESSVVQGDWEGDVQAWYHGMLLTPSGKNAILSATLPASGPNKMAANNSFHFGDGAKVHLVQGDGAIQTNVSGNDASVNVARGDNNTQTSQNEQPVSLAELVETLKQALSHNSFDSCRDEISHEIRGIELQLNKAEPKKSALERSFDYLKELAIKSAGAAASTTVVELIKHAPVLLSAANHLG